VEAFFEDAGRGAASLEDSKLAQSWRCTARGRESMKARNAQGNQIRGL
jgi:hypothetical protein